MYVLTLKINFTNKVTKTYYVHCFETSQKIIQKVDNQNDQKLN